MQLAVIAVSLKGVESADTMPCYMQEMMAGRWVENEAMEKVRSLIGPDEKSLQLHLPQFGCSANVPRDMGIGILVPQSSRSYQDVCCMG